jgi:hypothetical protein
MTLNYFLTPEVELLIFSDTTQLGDPREFGLGLQASF